MTGLRRILPADRKMLLVLAAPVLAITLVLVAGRVGNDSPTEPAAARSKATTTTVAGGSEATVAAASEQAVGADDSGSSGDGDSSGSGATSGGGSDVSGTAWTDGYSPSYSEEAQAVLGVDATGETTVPPAETTTTVAGATTSVPGATTTVPGSVTTTTIAQPPPAVNEAVIGALLPVTAVCFAALALGVLARRRRREGPVPG
jgi:hypothetical protein